MTDGTSTRFSRLAILEDQVGKPKTLSSRYYPFENRELVIVRHAETINEAFTDWLQRSQLSETSYVPFDLNMPVTLERRPNMRKSYESDPPISELSDTLVKKFAYELKDRCVVPTFIYCSPKYACLQTAMLIQKLIRHNLQYANHCVIRIDPCLDTTYNWMQHYFNKDDIERMGGVVDRTYQGPKMQKIDPNQNVYLPAMVTNVHVVFDQIKAQPEGVKLIITDSLAMRVLHNSLESNCTQHTIAVLNKLLTKSKSGSGSAEVESLAHQPTAAMTSGENLLLQKCNRIYPPLCSIVAFKELTASQSKVLYQICPLQLRPFTSMSYSNTIDLDADEAH